MSLSKALTAAAGNAGAGESLYVEDVFSTYLYTGNDTDTNIVNGINLADEGGLVWIKSRQAAEGHRLIDSEWSLSANKYIDSSSTSAPFSGPVVNTFNTDGFQLDSNWYGNSSDPQYGGDFVSWTFRKAEKFFDVVTYTGNGVAGREIAHNLGSTPACMIIKRTDSTGDWWTYHSSLTTAQYLRLNTTGSVGSSAAIWNDTAPTDSVFSLGDSVANTSGGSFVAYLFASDAGGFGDDGDESIIKCGSYTGNGSNTNGPVVNLGFEPQWLLVKSTSNAYDWMVVDTMRGMPAYDVFSNTLRPNTSVAEAASHRFNPSATGFQVNDDNGLVNASGGNYIYIAIRRPMKTPESGTEVFAVASGVSSTPTQVSGFPVDFGIVKRTIGSSGYAFTRLLQKTYLVTETTAAEVAFADATFDHMNGILTNPSFSANTYYSWMFKRATGFFDVVAYTGNGSAGHTIDHNLGVAPELIIVKSRSSTLHWFVYHSSLTSNGAILLSQDGPSFTGTTYWNDTDPTDTDFTLGTSANVNGSGNTYIAYLFATLAGVSKVGSYTGTGSNVDVDCGFSAGARFILIKRTDSTGDWYVWDSERGIVAGNDPYLLLNSTAAEVTSTDYIDPLASGFTVTSSAPAALNASGGTYIFLAIA